MPPVRSSLRKSRPESDTVVQSLLWNANLRMNEPRAAISRPLASRKRQSRGTVLTSHHS